MSKEDVQIIEGGAHIEPRALNDDDIDRLVTLSSNLSKAISDFAPKDECRRHRRELVDFIDATPLPYQSISASAYKDLPDDVADSLASVVREFFHSTDPFSSYISTEDTQERVLRRFLAAVRRWKPMPHKKSSETQKNSRKSHATRAIEKHAKMAAYLTQHHKYENGSVREWNHVVGRKMAEDLTLSTRDVSEWIAEQFGDHEKYKLACCNETIVGHLMKLNFDEPPNDHLGDSADEIPETREPRCEGCGAVTRDCICK